MNINKQHIKDGIKQTVCIVGIGNTLRSDDGAGMNVCKKMEEQHLAGVTVVTTQQLDIGMAEELTKFDAVIFVDASVNNEPISFGPLNPEIDHPQSFSHHINAAMLAALAGKLFTADTRFYICAVGGNNFETGILLSEKTLSNCNEAVSLLTKWICSET